MALTLWKPFGGISPLEREMDRLFNDFWTGGALDLPRTTWVPPLEVTENDDEFRVSMELPGVDEKDVEITFSDGLLSIRGEKKSQQESKDEMCYCSEVRYGSFERSLSVPANVSGEKISAKYKNGVLNIVLPKREEAKPRKVEIKTK